MPSTDGREILIVEKEDGIAKLFKRIFEPLGFRVTLCRNYATAADALRVIKFDWCITEWNLPGVGNGGDVTLSAITMGIPQEHIYILFGSAIPDDAPNLLLTRQFVPPDRFLLKPFSIGVFDVIVQA